MIKRLKPKSEFAGNVLLLMTGSIVAQAIPIAISPILTRIYTPEDFGLFAAYMAIVSLIVSISSLRYELAIPLAKSDKQATNVLLLSCLLAISIVILTGIIIAVYSGAIIGGTSSSLTIDFLWLIPIGVLFGGFYQIFSFWSVRKKDFKTISTTKIRRSLATAVIQLLGFSFGPVSLMISQVVGMGVGVYVLAKGALNNLRFDSVRKYSIQRIAKRYVKFPLFSAWAALFNVFSTNLPVICLTGFGYIEEAGMFLIAQRVLESPASILSSSINQVIHKDLSGYKAANRLGKYLEELIGRLAKASIGPAILIMLIAPSLTSIVFGDQWAELGKVLSYLIPFVVFSFIFSPMSTVISVMEWQKHGLFYQVLTAIISLVSLVFFLNYSEPLYGILAYSVLRSILILLYRGFLLQRLGVNVVMLVKILISNIILFSLYSSAVAYQVQEPSMYLLYIMTLMSLAIVSYIYINWKVGGNKLKN